MPQGRCPGCGVVKHSRLKMQQHVLSCEKYAAVYLASPGSVLDPEDEYTRWRESGDAQVAKEQAREVRLGDRAVELDRKRAAGSRRFATPPDPLA